MAGALIANDLGITRAEIPLGSAVAMLRDDGSEGIHGEVIAHRGYGNERRYWVKTETAGTIANVRARCLRRLTSERKD